MDSVSTLRTISEYIVELFPEAEGLDIGPDTKLEDIPGWDSMSAINFQTRLKTALSVSIPEEMLSGETTIGDILEHIHNG